MMTIEDCQAAPGLFYIWFSGEFFGDGGIFFVTSRGISFRNK